MFVLPGIASAHNPSAHTETECEEGTFTISADYDGGTGTVREYIRILDDPTDDQSDVSTNLNNDTVLPDGMTANTSMDNAVVTDLPFPSANAEFVEDGDPDYFSFTDIESAENFFELHGTYESVVNSDGSVTVYVLQTNDFDGDQERSGAVTSVYSDTDWEKCRITYCEAGDHNGGNDLSFLATPENNCDPVRICVDGESMTVTEFDAESLDGEKGSCTPSEEPPPPPPTITQEPPPEEPVEEETVSEVQPAVDEVIALPAAGYGMTQNASIAWTALLSLALTGLGGSTMLVMRLRK
jgi:hypothetical protein